MVPARRPDLFQTPEFQTQATAEGPSSERQESARLRHDLKRALEERNRAMKRLQETTARGGRGKGSRVLEQRLEEVRRELGQRNRENTRLLDMARAQAEQLAAIEPLPGLFLTRIKAIVRLAEGDDRGPDVGDLSTTPEALSGRLDGLMERLRRVLDRDHVLENHDLRQTLTQLQSALAAKRGEVLSLRVEQERLTQGLAAVEASQRQLKTEVASRNERFCGLQQHMKELEAENRQLINAQLTSKPQVKERVGPELFTFITGGSGRHIPLERWSQLLRPAPLAIGAALGLLLSLAGLWLTDYRLWVGGLGGGRVAGLTAQGPASSPLGTPSATTARTASGAVAPRPVTTAGGRVRTQRDALRDGGLGPELVQMAGGTFLMGTNRYEAPAIEKPAHRVNVSRFLIGRYEVTFDQYDAFAQATGRALPGDQGWGRAGRPVINVTWDDAQAYTQWISTQSGRRYRLPTEAEWEYAMAGGRQEIFWWGSAFERGREVCFDCGTRWDGRSPAPVGSAAPNPLGLYDMGGNVMEWVGDCLKTPDATAPVGTCELRMVRGGAFNKPDDTLHSTARRALAARDRFPMVGFRVVRE